MVNKALSGLVVFNGLELSSGLAYGLGIMPKGGLKTYNLQIDFQILILHGGDDSFALAQNRALDDGTNPAMTTHSVYSQTGQKVRLSQVVTEISVALWSPIIVLVI